MSPPLRIAAYDTLMILYRLSSVLFPRRILALYASVILFDFQVIVSHHSCRKQNNKVTPTYPVSIDYKIRTLKLCEQHAPFNTIYYTGLRFKEKNIELYSGSTF